MQNVAKERLRVREQSLLSAVKQFWSFKKATLSGTVEEAKAEYELLLVRLSEVEFSLMKTELLGEICEQENLALAETVKEREAQTLEFAKSLSALNEIVRKERENAAKRQGCVALVRELERFQTVEQLNAEIVNLENDIQQLERKSEAATKTLDSFSTDLVVLSNTLARLSQTTSSDEKDVEME